jgi:hypothetical protein
VDPLCLIHPTAFIPFATGGGRLVKTLAKLADSADDAADLSKTIEKGFDFTKTIDKAWDVTKPLDDIPTVARTLDKGTDITQTTAKTLSKLDEGLDAAKTEVVERWMSRRELKNIQNTGILSRGGRLGDHFVTNAANRNPLRARQRLSLDYTPEVRVRMAVPKGVFSSPRRVRPHYGMRGGGLERTAPGAIDIPARIVKVF